MASCLCFKWKKKSLALSLPLKTPISFLSEQFLQKRSKFAFGLKTIYPVSFVTLPSSMSFNFHCIAKVLQRTMSYLIRFFWAFASLYLLFQEFLLCVCLCDSLLHRHSILRTNTSQKWFCFTWKFSTFTSDMMMLSSDRLMSLWIPLCNRLNVWNHNWPLKTIFELRKDTMEWVWWNIFIDDGTLLQSKANVLHRKIGELNIDCQKTNRSLPADAFWIENMNFVTN